MTDPLTQARDRIAELCGSNDPPAFAAAIEKIRKECGA